MKFQRSMAALIAAIAAMPLVAIASGANVCTARAYLTFDTGNMSQAHTIAEILKKHSVTATFFLANERTPRGDYALDERWAAYWQARVAEGHAFGSHTWRHGRILRDTDDGGIQYRPQFGEDKGHTLTLSDKQFCSELRRVDQTFKKFTGQSLDALWRAPGGYVTLHTLRAAQQCGYSHVHWAAAGFLGDELPSEKYPNAKLLQRAVDSIRDGDVLMAHLGIWSRKEPFAPMLDPLIARLKERGFCFYRLTEHPDYVVHSAVPASLRARASGQELK